MKNRIQNITYTGVFIALILGVGFGLAFIPNIELITAIIFISGVLMGLKKGIIIGMISEFLFSALNPMGSGLLFPPMLISQVIAMSIVGLAGGLFAYNFFSNMNILSRIIIGITGFFLTLIYDIFVSIAFPISAGFTVKETIAAVIAGIGFSTIHLITNTVIFLVLIPIVIIKIRKAIPFFQN